MGMGSGEGEGAGVAMVRGRREEPARRARREREVVVGRRSIVGEFWREVCEGKGGRSREGEEKVKRGGGMRARESG